MAARILVKIGLYSPRANCPEDHLSGPDPGGNVSQHRAGCGGSESRPGHPGVDAAAL